MIKNNDSDKIEQLQDPEFLQEMLTNTDWNNSIRRTTITIQIYHKAVTP